MSRKKAKAPKPSAEELALRREQTELLRLQRDLMEQQLRQYNLLAPFLYEQMGLTPRYGDPTQALTGYRAPDGSIITPEKYEALKRGDGLPRFVRNLFKDAIGGMLDKFEPVYEDRAGQIIGFDKIESEEDRLRAEIERGLLERSLKALRGELDVSPMLERELGEREMTLREALMRQLGPGFETSSPGIEALTKNTTLATELREAARRGELTLAEQLSLARGADRRSEGAYFMGGVSGIPGMSPNFAGLATAFQSPISNFFNDRQLRAQVSAQNASRPSFGSTLGSIVGMGVGSMMGGFGTAIGERAGAKFGTWMGW